MRGWFRQHRFALGSALIHLRKSPGGFLLNVVVVAIALSLPFAGLTMLDNVRPMSEQMSVDPEISIFLKIDTPREQAVALAGEMRKIVHDQKAKIVFVPREQALDALKNKSGLADVLSTLGDNPLPDSYVLKLDAFNSASEAQDVDAVAEQLRHLPGVESAQVDSAWVKRLAADIRPLVRVSLTVIAEQNGRRETGSAGGGGRYSYDYFSDTVLEQYATDAVNSALVNLEARPAPAGPMTIVLGPGWPGILLHEAIGHGLEGDFNRKGSSAFSGCIGERVAAKGVTVVDDGTLAGRRGSLNIDDEGNPTQCTTLIEDGILKGYIQDTMNARLMKMPVTGNARRESFAHLPMPRMTNTYMLGGDKDPGEILASVKNGLYAVNFGGGQVDITNGKFVFSASEAYMIENGKLSYPVKGATLIGNGPDVLNRVSMIGNDMRLDSGVGVCGKEGQSVPVGVGQPTLRLDGITVGGTA